MNEENKSYLEIIEDLNRKISEARQKNIALTGLLKYKKNGGKVEFDHIEVTSLNSPYREFIKVNPIKTGTIYGQHIKAQALKDDSFVIGEIVTFDLNGNVRKDPHGTFAMGVVMKANDENNDVEVQLY